MVVSHNVSGTLTNIADQGVEGTSGCKALKSVDFTTA